MNSISGWISNSQLTLQGAQKELKHIGKTKMPEVIARAVHLRPNKGGYKINCVSRVYADSDTEGTYYFQSVQWACRHNNQIDFLPEGFRHDTFWRVLKSYK